MNTKEEKEAKKTYDLIAEYYHHHRTEKYPEGWFFNEMLEMPMTLSLIGNVKGKKVLDFGCGTGIYAKLLAEKGALVKGFDISEKMLKIARKNNPNLDLKQGSGYKIPFNEKFDVVFAALVLDYFKDWNKVFVEVNRVLKQGGCFIFSFGNPVSECQKKIIIGGKKFRVMGLRDYFEEDKAHYVNWAMYWKDLKNVQVKVPSYHKTYETIIRTINQNGFEIIDYKDSFPLKKAKKLFPRYYKNSSKTPYFSAFKVRKK